MPLRGHRDPGEQAGSAQEPAEGQRKHRAVLVPGPAPGRQAPPCLGPVDGQRAILQPAPEAAAPQREAIFGPVDVGRWVPMDHTVQPDAASHRFHQVGEGLPMQGGSLCVGRQQGNSQVPFGFNEAPASPARLWVLNASAKTNSFHVMGQISQDGRVTRNCADLKLSAVID